jgi:Flp pilus assembly protein CpaB
MPYARTRSQGTSRWVVALLVCLLVPLTAAGAVGGLWAFGKIDPLSWFSTRDQLPPGYVKVLASSVKIPAYTKITRDQLLDPKTGLWAFVPVPEGEIPKEAILSPNAVIGRVLNHDKSASYVFTERDFFPKGTRAGLAGAIPPGKVSLTLERTKIQGISGLQQQDRIDLTATIPVETPKASGNLAKGILQEAQMAAMEKLARVRVLATNAVLIEFTQHDKAITSRSISNGTQVKKVPVEEVVLAVSPEEVAPIQEALSTDVAISCVVRSGQPGDSGVATAGSDPLANITMIDAISGDKRESVVLPTYSHSQHTAAKPPRTSAASTSAPKSGASLWDNLTEAAKAH